jgi:hypothetical protein
MFEPRSAARCIIGIARQTVCMLMQICFCFIVFVLFQLVFSIPIDDLMINSIDSLQSNQHRCDSFASIRDIDVASVNAIRPARAFNSDAYKPKPHLASLVRRRAVNASIISSDRSHAVRSAQFKSHAPAADTRNHITSAGERQESTKLIQMSES